MLKKLCSVLKGYSVDGFDRDNIDHRKKQHRVRGIIQLIIGVELIAVIVYVHLFRINLLEAPIQSVPVIVSASILLYGAYIFYSGIRHFYWSFFNRIRINCRSFGSMAELRKEYPNWH